MCCLVRINSINPHWTDAYTYIRSLEIPTFIIAGHETTRYTCPSLRHSEINNCESWRSITMTWTLYSLSQNKNAQTKLREEICNTSTNNPTMDDLNVLPYMDTVVRETLRPV